MKESGLRVSELPVGRFELGRLLGNVAVNNELSEYPAVVVFDRRALNMQESPTGLVDLEAKVGRIVFEGGFRAGSGVFAERG
jgi:hypothetical protein